MISKIIGIFLFLSTVVSCAALDRRPSSSALYDGVEWKFNRTRRTVVIGDMHGDPDALLSILLKANLISRNNDDILWTGGKNVRLVMMGDCVAKWNRSADVLNLLIRLEKIMAQGGSQLHFVLGNHELLLLKGDYSKLTEKDRERFEKLGSLKDLFSLNGRYGSWLASKNTILQIGDWVFTHRGVGEWIQDYTPEEVNSSVRVWIRYWNGLALKPSDQIDILDFLFEGNSLDPRAKSINEKGVFPLDSLKKWLEALSAKTLFIGHYPMYEGPHPLYESLVWITDSGISKAIGGSLVYLDLGAEGGPDRFLRARRPPKAHSFRKAGCLKRLRNP